METKNKEVKVVHLAGSVWVSILESGIGIVVTFAVLWILSTESYGLVRITENTVSTILAFSNLGLTIALTHFVAGSLEEENPGNPVTYLLAATLVMAVAFFIVTTFTPLILIQLGLQQYFGPEYLICSGGFLLALLALLVQNFLKGLHEYARSLYSRLIQTITKVVVVPLTVILSTLGYFLGTFMTGFVSFALSVLFAVKSVRGLDIPVILELDEFKAAFRNLLSYGQKSFLSKILRQLYFTAPVWILAGVSETSVAMFSVALLLTSLVQLFPAAIRGYMLPTFTGFMARQQLGRVKNYYRNGIGFIALTCIPINVTLLFFPEAVLWLLKPSYVGSFPHILPLALASIIFCLWTFDSVLFYSAGNIQYSVMTEAVIASVTVVCGILTFSVLGEVSVSWGLLVGLGCGWIIQHMFVRNHFGITLGRKLSWKVPVLGLIASFICFSLLNAVAMMGFELTLFLSIGLAGLSLVISGISALLLSLIPKERICDLLNIFMKTGRQ